MIYTLLAYEYLVDMKSGHGIDTRLWFEKLSHVIYTAITIKSIDIIVHCQKQAMRFNLGWGYTVQYVHTDTLMAVIIIVNFL